MKIPKIEAKSIEPFPLPLDVWLDSQTMEPIRWTELSQWQFINGAFVVREISREEFYRAYPTEKD